MLDAQIYFRESGTKAEKNLNIKSAQHPLAPVLDLNDRALRNVSSAWAAHWMVFAPSDRFRISPFPQRSWLFWPLTTRLRTLRGASGTDGCRLFTRTISQSLPKTSRLLCGNRFFAGRDPTQPHADLENTPALVHCGPFANIAHGNSSVLA